MAAAIDWNRLEPALATALAGLDARVDRAAVERFAAHLAAGKASADANRLDCTPDPPRTGDVDDADAFSQADRARLCALGARALERGEVAVAVLAGGMATRFGGGVKGILPALGSRSFLEAKLAAASRIGRVPFLAMTSFATHRPTLAFLAARGLAERVRCFLQSVSLRLTPQGDLFLEKDGGPSLYAPGHGDFPDALRRSGALDALERAGVRALLLSNVDNLGADADPLVVGYHLAHGKPVTCEVARTIPGDAGGAPVRVRGELQLLEGFRFPRNFAFERLPFVNTNSFVFSTEALRREHALRFYYVEKSVDGRPAVQMEHLVGELSAFEATAYLGVARAGARARYFPVKTRADLEALRADRALVARFTGA